MIDRIDISEIIIPKSHREPKRVESLAESIKHVGQINAIIVRDDMQLIAGGRRLAACKLLGLTEIVASILSVSDIDAELMEIDENLERHELTVLQRGEQMARRKELYEARYPTTKAGGDKKSMDAKSNQNNFDLISFAEDTAQKAGVSSETVRQEVKIAQDIDDDVKDAIRGTELEDRKVDLLELSRLPKEEQGSVAEEAIKEKTTVAKVKAKRGVGKPKKPKKKVEPESTNGPIGKSKVNGEIVDDPPDIAERRRIGKIAPNAIPEVDQPEPGEETTFEAIKEEHEERQAIQADMSDNEWLVTLPLSSKLEGVPLKTFQGEAITYRKWERQIKARKIQGKEIWNQIKRKGPFAHRIDRGSNIDPPEKWLQCPSVENGGCNGEGRLRLGEGDLAKDVGQCTRCYGKGYWIK